ncbi:MAG: ABC transporter ATP-binding protein [Candidatus Izemoplasmatales bacterium]
MKAMKKVWRYIARNRKLLVITFLAMLVVQALGLAAPLLVKEILDNQLIGIENSWYAVEGPTERSVLYDGTYYAQKPIGVDPVSIVIYQGGYYFVEADVPAGAKALDGDTLTVTTPEGGIFVFTAAKLSHDDVLAFYGPFVQPLVILIVLLLVRFILQIVFTYIQRITTSMINVNMVRDARKDAIASLQRMPMEYFETEPAGKIANRVISDVGGMMNLFSTIMNLLVNATLSIVFAYIGMFYLDARLALITFVVFPIVYAWLRFFVKRLNTIAVKVNEQASMITARLNEIINGISILQIFNFQSQTTKDFDELSLDFMNEKMKEQRLHLSIGWNMIRLVGALVTAAIVFYFGNGYLTISGFVVTAGIVYAYNDYLGRLIEPVGTLFREIGNLEHAIVKTDRIFRIIDGEQEDGSFEAIPRPRGRIDFDNVWFSYQEGHPVLKGIDLHVNPGEMVGLVGHTGSGKSSLMSLLLRFYDFKDCDMGSIRIDGEDITTHSKRSFRKHVGIVLQDPVLFKGTLADNVRFGVEGLTDEEVEATLVRIGGKKILDKLPEGVRTAVARGGGNFSVGEKQIISFARAVVHDPAILVMDEATANIDTETEEMIQQALETVAKGRTMIVIAHRLSTIKNADRIVVLENGVKVEEGRHRDLLAKNGVYANIYRSQIKTVADPQG